MQVVVSGLLTTYSKVGKGKNTILFLHGWGDQAKTFEVLAADLVSSNQDLCCVLLDLPGFGGTQKPAKAWGLEDYVDFAHEFLNKTGLKTEIIIAHSNGGAIAIKGLAEQRLGASKLVLLASAGIREPSIKKTLLKVSSKPAKLALKALPKSQQTKVRAKLYGAVGSDYLVVEHMQDTFKRVVSTDVSQAAAKLKLPTLLIYGQDDDATPPYIGKKLASKIAKSSLEIIPKTGHFVHQEQVYKVSRLISEFIR